MDLREAAQLALEALEEHRTVRLHDGDYLGVCAWCGVDACDPCDHRCLHSNALTALRAALAEETMQRLTDVQQEMERQDGTGKTSDHIADANKMVPTINEMETVEPVAYVTGYFDGRCVIKPIEHVVFPTGTALYRLPPNQSEDALGMVEPVAYCTLEQLAHLKLAVPSEDKIAIYTAPPKREPLTEGAIRKVVDRIDGVTVSESVTFRLFARAIERAHGIGGEE